MKKASKNDSIAASIKVTQEIPWSEVASLLCTGLEGDMTSCWARIPEDGYIKPKKIAVTMDKLDGRPENECKVFPHIDYPLNEGGAIILADFEDLDENDEPKRYRLDREALIRGLNIMAEKYPRHFADFLQQNSDAITGDVYVQCCVFGDAIYG